ncbi:ferric reductase-like transmembrane domain-containing protein [aff. Roholtiella sp. LEGE 12411]|uniref:ferric reductase-like transmembrane domain-containing protein n=1 Tax=aff. Roholtiella sp. LEGE 12411 TaxID=1828822 RepID=UPI001882DA3D|nr:ferric reductase-like transmembrane domain-containing protein [aff. Roholtiella sp. LEGE 12411]MBE9034359.1 ferric reductase-like transmembrane domain-containing protein [aff. Roholtiella sp. LEGE 12411]
MTMRQLIVNKKSYIILVILALTTYLITLFLSVFCNPAPLANLLGFFALVAYIATLIPSIFKTVFPSLKSSNFILWLLKKRRYIGISAFFFGSNHGLLMLIQKHINLLSPLTYIEYFQGISILFIFSLLAVTSNDWSVRKLKNNWKNIHQLTYLVIFLLPWHVLDKMSVKWSYITPFAILLSLINLVFFILANIKVKLRIKS